MKSLNLKGKKREKSLLLQKDSMANEIFKFLRAKSLMGALERNISWIQFLWKFMLIQSPAGCGEKGSEQFSWIIFCFEAIIFREMRSS